MSRRAYECYVLVDTPTQQYFCTGARNPALRGWHPTLANATHFGSKSEACRARLSIRIDARSRGRIAIVGLRPSCPPPAEAPACAEAA